MNPQILVTIPEAVGVGTAIWLVTCGVVAGAQHLLHRWEDRWQQRH